MKTVVLLLLPASHIFLLTLHFVVLRWYIHRYEAHYPGSGLNNQKWRISASMVSDIHAKRARANTTGGCRPSMITNDTEGKMEEEMTEILQPPASLELPNVAKTAFALLGESMFPVFSIHNLDFGHLFKEHEVHYREFSQEVVDLTPTHPLYNFWRLHDDWKSDCDRFSVDEMRSTVSPLQSDKAGLTWSCVLYCITVCLMVQVVGKGSGKHGRQKHVVFGFESDNQR